MKKKDPILQKMKKKDPTLIDLRLQQEFYLHGDRHQVLVKYGKASIEVMRIKDKKRIKLDGNSKIIPIPNI